MKYYEIEVDGVDKTGKDLLTHYIALLSNHRFSINTRGIITQIAYAKKYNRNYNYDLSTFNKNKILVLLTAYVEDLRVRCSYTNEKDYTIEKDLELFSLTAKKLEQAGFIVLTYNTSEVTPYNITIDLISKINKLEITGEM